MPEITIQVVLCKSPTPKRPDAAGLFGVLNISLMASMTVFAVTATGYGFPILFIFNKTLSS
mgnify:FL=1